MSYSIILSDNFRKEAKKLLKKYASIRKELSEIDILSTENPKASISIGNEAYKIILSICRKQTILFLL
jgi:mRNA-degrading endonuclease RelE of RelBE toxin-antitoxin system